ncbi:flavin reductase [Oscillibacter sp.]|uniref:flavin reductase family protein n=1 Tax=Oscillibacter sp. TaxID=1945593 RepID=UPI002897759B|nr:flavin reductase [Oscillibacter sp.]
MRLKSVNPKELSIEALRLFTGRMPLLTAGDKTACNTMTIGWGGLGSFWNRPACTVYVRHSRYTFQFMESNDYFTVSILPKERKDALTLCGTRSGRDTDKIADCGFTLCYGAGDAPFFDEAELVLVCRKLYAQDMTSEFVIDSGAAASFYPEGDWHRMYIGEVVEAYQA